MNFVGDLNARLGNERNHFLACGDLYRQQRDRR